MDWEDILRSLVIGQAVILIILTSAIIVRYASKLLQKSEEDRALPIHVMLISLSYLVLVGKTTYEIYLRVGQEMTWRTPVTLVAFALGTAALIFMLVHLSVKRALITAILAKARSEAAKEIERQRERSEQRFDRLESVAQTTHDTVVEMREDADRAVNTAKQVAEKADDIGVVGQDTNARVRKLQNGDEKKETI